MSQEQTQNMNVMKATLSTGKVALLRQIEMRDEEMAAMAASKKSGDNGVAMAYLMQNELVKILLVEFDGKKLTANDRETLTKNLSHSEFTQLRIVIQKMMGETPAEPVTEFVNSGS